MPSRCWPPRGTCHERPAVPVTRNRKRGTGRRPPRFPAMARRYANTLLALSGAILFATVIGVQLGQSAIGEIKPIHFGGAAEPPRAIDPATLRRPAGDSFAAAYGWEQGYAARAHACEGNCDAHEARRAAAIAIEPIAAEPAAGPYWRDATSTDEPKPWAPGETGGRRLSVERYMHYPVETASVESAPVETALVEAEAEAAGPKVLVFDESRAD